MVIGITQRIEVLPYGEVRDCLDLNLARLVLDRGHIPVPLCTAAGHVSQYLRALKPDAVILSGGNDLAHLPNAANASPLRDRFESEIIAWCIAETIPLLGICRGLQMLNHYLGGSLRKIEGHVACRHAVISGKETLVVNSYHNWGIKIEDLAPGLEICALADNEWVEAFCAQHITAIMWHPERELLENLNDPFVDAFFKDIL